MTETSCRSSVGSKRKLIEAYVDHRTESDDGSMSSYLRSDCDSITSHKHGDTSDTDYTGVLDDDDTISIFCKRVAIAPQDFLQLLLKSRGYDAELISPPSYILSRF